MLLWFVGPSVLIVWKVFQSPAADYRLVAIGSLLPLVELPVGEPRLFHSLTGGAILLAAVMIGARGQRLVQRRLLGLPIGVLVHLALDGAWADTHGFWWPFLGPAWSSSQLPELGRGGINVVLELAGVGACWWGWRRFRLDEPERRRDFLQTGRVGRDIVP
ncbi:MAG: hypothetical protein WD691_00990 [Acidimicrobiales bacterium]